MKILLSSLWLLFVLCTVFQPSPTPTPVIRETSTPLIVPLDQPFQLRVGQRAMIGPGDLTLELQTILSDWRCPTQVQCAEAGAVDLAIYAWLTALEPTRFEMTTNPPLHQDTIPYESYEIRLLAVDPPLETIEQIIPMEDYVVTFMVSLKTE